MIRVAALQFASGTNVEENLERCLRLIDEAVRQHAPQLLVLPAFVNHSPRYDDEEHARRVAVTLDGPFLTALAEAARRHAIHLALHVSLLQGGERLSASSVCLGANGELLYVSDAGTLPEPLSGPFSPGRASAFEVVATPLGRLASYVGEDLNPLWARGLALHGAEILCVHFSGLGGQQLQDEVVTRAAENRVLVVAASQPRGAAEDGDTGSLIVSADGELLARAPAGDECTVAASLEAVRSRSEQNPLFTLRRPELYRGLGARSRSLESRREADKLEVVVAPAPSADTPEAAIEESAQLLRSLALESAPLVVLPELFCFAQAEVGDPAQAAELFVPTVRRLSEACAGSGLQVVTSLVERVGDTLFHMGVLLGHAGIIARQPQLHVPARHAWATPGRRVETVQLPWGRLAMAVGEDALSPEQLGLCALLGARLVARPFARAETWELKHAPRAFAAAYGVSIAAAGRAEQAVLVDASEPGRQPSVLERAGQRLLHTELRFRAPSSRPARELERALLDTLTSRGATATRPELGGDDTPSAA